MRSLTIIWTILLSFSSAASKNILAGVNLKLSACENYPYDSLVRGPDGNITWTGSTVEVVDWLAAKLNFTYTIVPALKEEASRLNISDYVLSLKNVLDKKADGTAIQFIVNPDRASTFDFTFFITTERFTLIVPKPTPISRLFAFIRPFQPIVWLFIGSVSLIIIGMMSWFSWIYEHKTSFSSQSANQSRNGTDKLIDRFGYYIIYVTNILTNHGICIPYAQHSFRILASGWLLAALVLVNSYSSIVVSSLTVPLQHTPINSFKALAASKDVVLILRKDLVITQLITGATTGVIKIIGDSIRAHPDRLFNDYPSLLTKLEDGQHAFFFITTFNRVFVRNQYKKNDKCNFLLTDPLPLSNGYFCMQMQKGSPYTSTINSGLVRLFETGLNLYWVDKQTPMTEQCTVANEKKSQSVGRQTKIKLKDLTSAFFILGAGLGASILSFLIELVIYRIRKQIKKFAEIERNSS